MQEDITDTMLVTPEAGFAMVFFDAPEAAQLNIDKLYPYVDGAKYAEGQTPDGYNCQVLGDAQGPTILMKGVNSEGNVLIRSGLRPLELSHILKNVPQDMRLLVNGALKNHLPELTDLSRAWISANDYHKQMTSSMEIIQGIPSLNASRELDFAKDNSFTILQGECGVTSFDADCPVLGSGGAGPCVILSVYNEAAKKGFLCHIDDAIDLDEISALIFEMRTDSDQPLVANMAGGWSDTYNMIADIVLRLEEQPNVRVGGWGEADNVMTELALDTRNGKVYQGFGADQLDSGPLFEARMSHLERCVTASFSGEMEFRAPLPVYHYTTGRDTVMALQHSQ